jgi:hypothetical protein
LVPAEEALALQLLNDVGVGSKIQDIAFWKLVELCSLAPEAFAESKRMRVGNFCADVRNQMSARVARHVETWNSDDAQMRLRAAAGRLAR